MLNKIYNKIRNNERITPSEGLALLQKTPLLDIGELASAVRYRKNPESRVTFAVDTNPNYTNVCTIDCIFCAFYRHPGEEGEYTYSVDNLIQQFKESAAKGVTTVLLQGGVNPKLPLEYYTQLVRRTREGVPGIYPHFFSVSEIVGMSQVSGFTITEVLKQLWDAGLRSIPGGGAEILSDRVKKKISNKKENADEWLDVMRQAHKIGYRSTATMMYGHIETDEEIIEHLERVRSLQDETGGFTAFIPWSFKPGNTPLEKIIPQQASPTRYLQIIALSRIYLDNIDHIQASWFSEGKKIGQIALHFGADDFGGTLLEENVHAAANYVSKTNTEEVINMIAQSGFIPAQRTTLYEIVKYFDQAEAS
jgi:cyclic dehypoxanthinyl futalosine synthase